MPKPSALQPQPHSAYPNEYISPNWTFYPKTHLNPAPRSWWTQPTSTPAPRSWWTQPTSTPAPRSWWTQPTSTPTPRSWWTQPTSTPAPRSWRTQPTSTPAPRSWWTQPTSTPYHYHDGLVYESFKLAASYSRIVYTRVSLHSLRAFYGRFICLSDLYYLVFIVLQHR